MKILKKVRGYTLLLIGLLGVSLEVYCNDKSPVLNTLHPKAVFERLAIYSGSQRIHPLVIEASPIMNAWTNGTYITITTGLLSIMKNDDEVALVLAHEIAHDLAYDVPHIILLKDLNPMNSNENEANADKLGAFIMMRAGFDICKGKEIMKTFRENFGDDAVDIGHPSNAFRLDQLNLPQCN